VRWPVYARRWKDNEKEKKKASVKLTEILPYVCYIYIQKKRPEQGARSAEQITWKKTVR
jgi:hypothetical protein